MIQCLTSRTGWLYLPAEQAGFSGGDVWPYFQNTEKYEKRQTLRSLERSTIIKPL
jgi:hypothetical protein